MTRPKILLTLVMIVALLVAYAALVPAHGRDGLWQAQVTICKAGPILSGWDKTCRNEFIKCPTAQACLTRYPAMAGEGEVVKIVRLTSPERP